MKEGEKEKAKITNVRDKRLQKMRREKARAEKKVEAEADGRSSGGVSGAAVSQPPGDVRTRTKRESTVQAS